MTNNELMRYIEMHRTMLYRLAYSATLDHADSEDIVQEAFVRLYTSHKELDDEAAKAWLIRVTVNLCKNRNKLFRVRNTAELDDNIPCADNSISDELIALKAAMRELPQKYRVVIYLHYYAGYQASEIGGILGISTSAVTTRMQRGREKLKDFLDDEVKT